MKSQSGKLGLAAAWSLLVVGLGWLAAVGSLAGWSVLAIVALVPALTMLQLWKDPPQTISESINAARR